MASEYVYDEEGEVWPYFVLAILTFILIPLTWRYVSRIFDKNDPLGYNKLIPGAIVENHHSLQLNEKSMVNYTKSKASDRIVNRTLIVLIIGWFTVFYIAFNMTKPADMTSVFDPYEILGISASATEKQIKSHYRKLSLKFHPDKMPKDLSEDEQNVFEQAFVKLNKAYKALTDEVTRENYLKYGHPDGRQDTSHGIALPKFLVEGKYSLVMIVFYFLLIGGLLPFVVGSWWNDVKSHTAKGLHVETASKFTKYLTDKNPGKVITPFDLLDLFCESYEIKQVFSHLSSTQIKDLINEYLDRKVSDDKSLEVDKLKIIAAMPQLIENFIEIAVVFRHIDVILVALDLQKSIIQAVKLTGKYKDLLQLPYVDPEVIESQSVKKLGKLFTKDCEPGKVLGIKDEKKLSKTLEIAQKIASLRVIGSDFKVPGESVVPPLSKAHLSLKILVKPPNLKSCPEIPEERLIDEETIEYMKDPTVINNQQPLLPFSYCPYFPTDIVNNWTGILVNQKDNKVAESSPIISLTNIDLKNIQLDQESWINGEKATIGILNIPLPAHTPQAVGSYPFRLILKNNAYFGVDVDIPVTLKVENPPPVTIDKNKILGKESDSDSDSESDISDPEEDSLAGALAALRGAPVKKSQIEELGDDEDEEEEDDDDESVFTDINTDTEDEED